MKRLLLGDEAIALGALHAGLSGVYAYPEPHPQKSRSLFRAINWPVNAMFIHVGVPMKRRRWRQRSACRMPANVRWSA